jgi:hypothetical protein
MMNWGKPVQWIGLQPAMGRAIAEALIKNAEEAEQQIKGLKF